jgi:hypothetical protein
VQREVHRADSSDTLDGLFSLFCCEQCSVFWLQRGADFAERPASRILRPGGVVPASTLEIRDSETCAASHPELRFSAPCTWNPTREGSTPINPAQANGPLRWKSGRGARALHRRLCPVNRLNGRHCERQQKGTRGASGSHRQFRLVQLMLGAATIDPTLYRRYRKVPQARLKG